MTDGHYTYKSVIRFDPDAVGISTEERGRLRRLRGRPVAAMGAAADDFAQQVCATTALHRHVASPCVCVGLQGWAIARARADTSLSCPARRPRAVPMVSRRARSCRQPTDPGRRSRGQHAPPGRRRAVEVLRSPAASLGARLGALGSGSRAGREPRRPGCGLDRNGRSRERTGRACARVAYLYYIVDGRAQQRRAWHVVVLRVSIFYQGP